MAGSVNKVILIGNLGADPEIRRTQDGRPIANLRIATSESWRDKNTGERKEKTEWHRVVIFNEGLCKIAEQYLKKGSKVYLEGALQTRKWQDKDGQDKYSTEVVLQGFNSSLTMLDGRGGGGGGARRRGGRRFRLARPDRFAPQTGDGRRRRPPRRHGRRDSVLTGCRFGRLCRSTRCSRICFRAAKDPCGSPAAQKGRFGKGWDCRGCATSSGSGR